MAKGVSTWNRSRTITLAHRGAAAHGHRHRPDHPGALPAHHVARGPGQAAVRRLALPAPTARRNPDFVLNRADASGCAILVARTQFRLRLLARARALGAARLRHPRRHQHARSPTSSAPTRSRTAWCRWSWTSRRCDWLLANPGVERDHRHRDSHAQAARWTQREFPIEPFARYCLLHGVDQLGYLLANETPSRPTSSITPPRDEAPRDEGDASPSCAGDGIGPEVTREGVRVLQAVAQRLRP